MKKKIYYTAGILPIAAGILASFLTEDDLIQISDILEQLIQGNGSPVTTETADSLVSKLQAQTVKIHAIVTKYNEKLLEEQEEVRRFLSEIAHQIRTPLTNMETYLSLLREQELTAEEQDTCIRAVEQSERKIKFLTESFISASRMEHRIIQIRKERQNLRKTLAKAIFQVRRKAEEKHMEITLDCPENISLPHDRNWISEAAANLLDSNVNSQEGFGIGLYITREIVKQHEGFLKVKREADGTSISIYLPC